MKPGSGFPRSISNTQGRPGLRFCWEQRQEIFGLVPEAARYEDVLKVSYSVAFPRSGASPRLQTPRGGRTLPADTDWTFLSIVASTQKALCGHYRVKN